MVLLVQLGVGMEPLLSEAALHGPLPNRLPQLHGQSFMDFPCSDTVAWRTNFMERLQDLLVFCLRGFAPTLFPATNLLSIIAVQITHPAPQIIQAMAKGCGQ